MWTGDLKEVSLCQTQLTGDVLPYRAQRIIIPEQTEHNISKKCVTWKVKLGNLHICFLHMRYGSQMEQIFNNEKINLKLVNSTGYLSVE